MTAVTSAPNTSVSSPATPLPSSQVSWAVISTSRRSEALGVDPVRRVAELDERVGDRLDEARRAAEEHQRALGRGRADGLEQLAVHAAIPAVPSCRALARERAVHRQTRTFGEARELVAVEEVAERARGDQQPGV